MRYGLIAVCILCLASLAWAQEEAEHDVAEAADAAVDTVEEAAQDTEAAAVDFAAESEEAMDAEGSDPADPAEPVPAAHGEAHGEAAHGEVAHGEAAHGEVAHGEGHGEHHGFDWVTFVVTVINFAILLYLLIRFGKGPINGFLSARRQTYLEALEEARRQKAEADARAKEYTDKLANIQAEAEEIVQRAVADAERRKTQIIEAAEKSAERMKADAKMTIDSELLKAQTEIRGALAALVLEKAEALLVDKLDDADRARLNEEFVKKLEEAS